MKLEGLTNDEIAGRSGKAGASVERRLNRIRRCWQGEGGKKPTIREGQQRWTRSVRQRGAFAQAPRIDAPGHVSLPEIADDSGAAAGRR